MSGRPVTRLMVKIRPMNNNYRREWHDAGSFRGYTLLARGGQHALLRMDPPASVLRIWSLLTLSLDPFAVQGEYRANSTARPDGTGTPKRKMVKPRETQKRYVYATAKDMQDALHYGRKYVDLGMRFLEEFGFLRKVRRSVYQLNPWLVSVESPELQIEAQNEWLEVLHSAHALMPDSADVAKWFADKRAVPFDSAPVTVPKGNVTPISAQRRKRAQGA